MKNIRIRKEIYKCMYNFDESCNYLVAFEEYGKKYVIPCQDYVEFTSSFNHITAAIVNKLCSITVIAQSAAHLNMLV